MSLLQLCVKLFSVEEKKSHQLMVQPGKNTHTVRWRIVFPFTPVTYFVLDCFFPELFVFSHMKLDRETFDHTMCEVNTEKKASMLLQRGKSERMLPAEEVKLIQR